MFLSAWFISSVNHSQTLNTVYLYMLIKVQKGLKIVININVAL